MSRGPEARGPPLCWLLPPFACRLQESLPAQRRRGRGGRGGRGRSDEDGDRICIRRLGECSHVVSIGERAASRHGSEYATWGGHVMLCIQLGDGREYVYTSSVHAQFRISLYIVGFLIYLRVRPRVAFSMTRRFDFSGFTSSETQIVGTIPAR